jgi:hypothetical protein
MGMAVAPQYIGARHTGAANVAIILAACPALVTLVERLVWKAPLGRRQAWGLLLAIAGVLVVLSKGDLGALGQLEFGRGDLWVVLAAIGWSLYTVFNKRLPLPPLPGTVKLAALIGGGALVLAPFAALEALQRRVPPFGDSRLYVALAFLADRAQPGRLLLLRPPGGGGRPGARQHVGVPDSAVRHAGGLAAAGRGAAPVSRGGFGMILLAVALSSRRRGSHEFQESDAGVTACK